MAEKSICIIDPFENVFNVFRMILEEKGYKVFTAASLEKAIAGCSYSIIITEFFSPLEKVCHFIKTVKSGIPETYLIMSTSVIMDELNYKTLFDAGLDDLLVKPYGQEILLAHIEKGIKRQELFIEHEKMIKDSGRSPLLQEDYFGVFGPVYFKKLLRQEIKKAKRHQQPVSLILLKLPSKDKLGSEFAPFYGELIKLLRKSVREEDLLGRENGNLGIILDQTDQMGSQNLGRRLSDLIQTHPTFQSNQFLQKFIKELAFQYFTFPSQTEIPDFLAPLLKDVDTDYSSN